MSKRILIVNDEMVVGGVARVLNNLLTTLVKTTDYEIDLLVLHKHGEMLKGVPKEVRVLEGSKFFSVIDLPLGQLIKSKHLALIARKLYLVFLMKAGMIGNKIKRERKKMKLDSYDVEIAFKEGFCTIFVANGNSKKKVNWVHLDYKVQNFSSNYMPLLKKTLSLMDEQVAVSKVAAASYQEVFELSKPVKVIHNIIQEDLIKQKYNVEIDETRSTFFKQEALTFISVGRLVDQKGYDRLLEIHHRLIQEGLLHHIMIIGGGEEEAVLKQKIKAYQVEETFKLIGYRENPFPYFKLADCFLLPSRYEGLPTVVFESLLCLTPVLATKVAGIEEQLKNNEYGIVVDNNENSFYEGMKDLIKHPEQLNVMEAHLLTYHYHNNQIVEQIKEIVEE
ncbi:glycosyltransferase [Turicibacter sanguinis]|uniref:glycosyltransferase n=1 Tax=Turicibacter sanguinis TaxID=154288 RepID=UPI00233155D5|nr:glycosyltransferase [Turicibacter sanguinis]MDB8573852.1 glycosyltransferase [Turicibacter sanguinis]MDB8576961.1 glycosyltransferase [Turicibacter sanguinis]MDB8582989.1 glycosyltransferase [Turicibacter sanguinis]MDB8586002.1 glycosyltransferase [Turicibacter sanguinis]MDB8596400.1 glycosyltransferase [Turicibacter sanguinis]